MFTIKHRQLSCDFLFICSSASNWCDCGRLVLYRSEEKISILYLLLELDRYIGNTHHRGRLWNNRNHRNNRQSMTIGDQSVPMFHDDVTHRIHLAMVSVGHPCSTI